MCPFKLRHPSENWVNINDEYDRFKTRLYLSKMICCCSQTPEIQWPIFVLEDTHFEVILGFVSKNRPQFGQLDRKVNSIIAGMHFTERENVCICSTCGKPIPVEVTEKSDCSKIWPIWRIVPTRNPPNTSSPLCRSWTQALAIAAKQLHEMENDIHRVDNKNNHSNECLFDSEPNNSLADPHYYFFNNDYSLRIQTSMNSPSCFMLSHFNPIAFECN